MKHVGSQALASLLLRRPVLPHLHGHDHESFGREGYHFNVAAAGRSPEAKTYPQSKLQRANSGSAKAARRRDALEDSISLADEVSRCLPAVVLANLKVSFQVVVVLRGVAFLKSEVGVCQPRAKLQ